MNAIIKTCPRTKKKTAMRLMSKMKVDGIKGKSELTIQPNYLSKEICDASLQIFETQINCVNIIAKGKRMMTFALVCIMMSCHEDSLEVVK